MSAHWQKLLQFRCTCCGNCCREPIVLVTDEDVRRVVSHTQEKPEDIVRFYRPNEVAWGTRNPGWIRFRGGRRILGLRRNRRGCRYLDPDDLCTIYAYRPVTCRRYPFDVELDAQGGLEGMSISRSVDCPYELDGQTLEAEIASICAWEDAEESPYHQKVKSWNRRRSIGTQRSFLDYVGL